MRVRRVQAASEGGRKGRAYKIPLAIIPPPSPEPWPLAHPPTPPTRAGLPPVPMEDTKTPPSVLALPQCSLSQGLPLRHPFKRRRPSAQGQVWDHWSPDGLQSFLAFGAAAGIPVVHRALTALEEAKQSPESLCRACSLEPLSTLKVSMSSPRKYAPGG